MFDIIADIISEIWDLLPSHFDVCGAINKRKYNPSLILVEKEEKQCLYA